MHMEGEKKSEILARRPSRVEDGYEEQEGKKKAKTNNNKIAVREWNS